MSKGIDVFPLRRLDRTNYKPMRTLLASALDGTGCLILDLSECGYIDATGLGVLVKLNKRARHEGKTFRIDNPSADIETLFEMTKLNTVFHIHRARRRSPEYKQWRIARDALMANFAKHFYGDPA